MPDSVTFNGITWHIGDVVSFVGVHGFDAGVLTQITSRRSGGDVLHLLFLSGSKGKVNIEDARQSGDARNKRLREMAPAEADEERRIYLKKFIKKAEKNRLLYQTEATDTPKPRGRTAAPADTDRVRQFIETVTNLKVAAKKQIVSALGDFTASEWNKITEAALATGEVERHGERRAAKYTVPGYKVEKIEPKDDVQVRDYADKVFKWMKIESTSTPYFVAARSDIMNALPTDNVTYQAAMKLLVDDGKLVKTGQKRGTKYHVA